ncbi:MAG TPA: MMPL family transporter [Acidimicrobiales bacterium]|nr:MMPL family transporter [Acidimicrobiales bacterium]
MPSAPSKVPTTEVRRATRSGSGGTKLALLGEACARRPFIVVLAWVGVLVAVLVGSVAAGGRYSDNVNLPGTESYTGSQLLSSHDKAASGYSGTIVLQGAIAACRQAVEGSRVAIARLPHVVSVSDPWAPGGPSVAPDGRTAYMQVHLDVVPAALGQKYFSEVKVAAEPMARAGLRVEYSGGFDNFVRPRSADGRSELIGFAVAIVVLIVGFGSVAGAGLPLVTALFSVLVGVSTLGIASSVATFGTASPTLALMIGLGVGIDYALFLTTRFRQAVINGVAPVEAARGAVASSGRAVLVAASTVSVALLGLFASGVSFLGMLGLAAVFAVVTAALGSVTLVPAFLGLLGQNIDRFRVGKVVAEAGSDGDGWHRYAKAVGRKPWAFLAAGMALLAVLAVPLLSIHLGHVDDGADPPSYSDRQAYDAIAKAFGPGVNGTFAIVVQPGKGTSATAEVAIGQRVYTDLQATRGVARATPLSAKGGLLIGTVVPVTPPQQPATQALFHRLLGSVLPSALKGTGAKGYVTGATASQIQFASVLTGALPVVILVVVATAFLLVLVAFRSLLLAVKAAVLNLVSISAAYGVIVAVFQWGWGRSLLGVGENVPIESYVPIIMFAIVFGLSMDYEVFLLTRVKEAWDATGSHRDSVAQGLSSTGRVITCAALIMASVFIAFVASGKVVIKMIAVGLSSSVVIDATVVRLLLVPSVMYILGPSCWWLPSWLDRLLPHIDIERPAGSRTGSTAHLAPREAVSGPS